MSKAVQNNLNPYQSNHITNSNLEHPPLESFSSQQMESFLGFSMIPNEGNNFQNFSLSEKSSFKSYSERDPSEIDNPFCKPFFIF